MKVIIFDSSPIINFALNGILPVLEKLKKEFNGKFIITDAVKREIIDHPLETKRFELEALQIKKLLDNKTLELASSLGIDSNIISSKSNEIMNKINHTLFAKNNFIHLVDDGETSCIALSLLLNEKGIENVFAVDERTMRMLCENPINVKRLIEKKTHSKVEIKSSLKELENVKCIRSCELVFIAYKKKLVEIGNGQVLDALLYATKFKGASISESEILEIERLAKTI